MKREPENNLVMPGLQVHGWLILSCAPDNRHGAKMVRCRCSCGVEREVVAYDIRRGASRDCGHTKMAAFANDRHKHGHSPRGARSSTLKSWKGLLHRYGDRVVPDLRELSAFIATVGERPSKAHHLRVLDTHAPIITASGLRWELRRSTTIPKNVARAARRVAAAEARANASD